MTTASEISVWFDRGKKDGAAYMLVICDHFDHDDYPVYASAKEVWDKHDHYDGKNMQSVMEVYDLSADKAKQFSTHRVFNLPPRPASSADDGR